MKNAMQIHPFLAGQAFDPETIDKMSEALQYVEPEGGNDRSSEPLQRLLKLGPPALVTI